LGGFTWILQKERGPAPLEVSESAEAVVLVGAMEALTDQPEEA